jgi:sugar O-acyltransferase (sialic acid O-acetyltransferase NeuD family)
LVIIGAGGQGRETAAAFLLSSPRSSFVGFLDDAVRGTTKEGWPVLGPIERACNHPDCRFVIAVSDPRVRRTIADRLRSMGISRWANVIHPDVYIHPSIRLGVGCAILGGSSLAVSASLGDHCIVNRGCQIGHDCEIGDLSSLNPSACIGGCVRVGSGAELGSACAIRQGLQVGNGSTVGMGSVVIRDVPENSVIVGNPARHLRWNAPW